MEHGYQALVGEVDDDPRASVGIVYEHLLLDALIVTGPQHVQKPTPRHSKVATFLGLARYQGVYSSTSRVSY